MRVRRFFQVRTEQDPLSARCNPQDHRRKIRCRRHHPPLRTMLRRPQRLQLQLGGEIGCIGRRQRMHVGLQSGRRFRGDSPPERPVSGCPHRRATSARAIPGSRLEMPNDAIQLLQSRTVLGHRSRSERLQERQELPRVQCIRTDEARVLARIHRRRHPTHMIVVPVRRDDEPHGPRRIDPDPGQIVDRDGLPRRDVDAGIDDEPIAVAGMDENALAVAGTEDGHLHFTAPWRRSQTHFPIPGFCRSLRLRAERRRAHLSSRPAGGGIERANAASADPFCRYSLQCSSRRWRRARRAPCPRRIPPTNKSRPLRPESADRDRRGEPETRRSRLPIRRLPSVRMSSRCLSSHCSTAARATFPAARPVFRHVPVDHDCSAGRGPQSPLFVTNCSMIPSERS